MESLGATPFVSIVFISWNRKDVLKTTLTCLARQTYPKYEIVVVDNGSTDGAPEMASKEFPNVKLIRLKENLGIKGYNIAFENSLGEIIIILDNDSYLEDDGISKVVNKFQKYPKLGALGCKVYNHFTGKIHHWHPSVKTENGPEEGFDTPLFNGCAAAARSSILKEVGFYPEEFFLYENERDLCTRIIDAGYDVKYFTDIVGYHMEAGDGRSNERRIFYSTRNLIWYYWKYMPIMISLRRTKDIMVNNILAALKNKQLKMYLRPLLAAIIGLPRILITRSPIKKEYISKALY